MQFRKLLIPLTVFSFFFLSSSSYSQSRKEIRKEKERMLDTLQNKMSGVKFADLGFSKAQEDIFINNSNSGDALILSGITNYLKDLGLLVIVTQDQRNQAIKLAKSQCDYVKVSYEIGEFKSKFMAIGNYPFKFSVQFCDKSIYSFNTKVSVNGMTNYPSLIKNTCNFNFPIKRKYNEINRLKITNNQLVISNSNFSSYLDTSVTKKAIEGVYQLFSSDANTSKYTIGIYSHNDTLKAIYFKGADLSEDWKEGEVKGYLFSTLSENDYIVKWYALDKSILDGSITFTSKNAFEFKSITLGYDKGADRFVRIE